MPIVRFVKCIYTSYNSKLLINLRGESMKIILFLLTFLLGTFTMPAIEIDGILDLEKGTDHETEVYSGIANMPFIFTVDQYEGIIVELMNVFDINECFKVEVQEDSGIIFSGCPAGGVGSTSCEYSWNGGSCSVTCSSGYYSCCGIRSCTCETIQVQ